jgi:hypothetical protein
VRVSCERAKVPDVEGEHHTVRFRRDDDERVDHGTASGSEAKGRCPANEHFGDALFHVARSEEPIHVGVAAGVTGQALDEHRGGNKWRRELLSTESREQSARS